VPVALHTSCVDDTTGLLRGRALVTSRPFRSFRVRRMVRSLNSLRTTPPVHLNRARIVAARLSMLISHMIGPIKPSKFAAAVGPTIIPSFQLTIFTPIEWTILPSVGATIFLPHLSGRSHANITPSTTAMVVLSSRTAIHRPGAAIVGADSFAVLSQHLSVSGRRHLGRPPDNHARQRHHSYHVFGQTHLSTPCE